MAKRKVDAGSIFVRKGTNKITIKYRGIQLATGLNNTPANKKIAQELLKKLHYEQINYEPPQRKQQITMREAFTVFIDEHCKHLSKNSIRLYVLSYKSISPSEFVMNDNTISSDVERFMESNNLTASTVLTYLQHYSVFVNFCLRRGWITTFPEKLRMERRGSYRQVKRKVVEVFEREEFERIVEYFKESDYEYALLLMLLWHTGGRITETLSLTWSQVDFRRARLRYSNKINSNEDDYIPISSVAMSILKQLKEMNVDKVFRWSPATYSRLSRRLKDAMDALGIDRNERGFHTIRRTFATNLIENDVAIADVKDLMRHKDIKTTLQHYKAKKSHRLNAILEQTIVSAPTAPSSAKIVKQSKAE